MGLFKPIDQIIKSDKADKAVSLNLLQKKEISAGPYCQQSLTKRNIQNAGSGLKLELLLATINNECQNAQFLLLTPFIRNAAKVAQQLGDTSSDDISFSVNWQPNDRAIGVASLCKGKQLKRKGGFSYHACFETLHTIRNTIKIKDTITRSKNNKIAGTYNQASSVRCLSAIIARHFASRGPVIIVHSTIPLC